MNMLSSPLLPALWLPRAAQRLLHHPLDMGLLRIRVTRKRILHAFWRMRPLHSVCVFCSRSLVMSV